MSQLDFTLLLTKWLYSENARVSNGLISQKMVLLKIELWDKLWGIFIKKIGFTMSAFLRTSFSAVSYPFTTIVRHMSTDKEVADSIRSQFPSSTDAKVEDIATFQIATNKESTQPVADLQSAQVRETYLVAQIKAAKAFPGISTLTVKEIVHELVVVQRLIAAHKQ